MVLDLRLPDMSGFELLHHDHDAKRELTDVPIVVFTGQDLSESEQMRLRVMAKSVVLKDVQSPERLLDETALFLHRAGIEPTCRRTASACWKDFMVPTKSLSNRTILVVDDDACKIFSRLHLYSRITRWMFSA